MADVTLYHLRINPITGNAYMADQGSSPAMPQYVLATDYEALRKRCEAVEADAARLDWLDANCFTAYRDRDPIDGLSEHCVVVDESKRPRRGNVADGIRDAIDQAIAAAQEPSHG